MLGLLNAEIGVLQQSHRINWEHSQPHFQSIFILNEASQGSLAISKMISAVL